MCLDEILIFPSGKKPDIILIGFQEIIELNPQNVIKGSDS
jgi:hypothetical protein